MGSFKKGQQKNFVQLWYLKKHFIYDFIAISNHFVVLRIVCYWEENICKQIEIPYLPTDFCQYPLIIYLGSYKTFNTSLPTEKFQNLNNTINSLR